MKAKAGLPALVVGLCWLALASLAWGQPGTVQFGAPAFSGFESSGEIVVSVTRSGGTDGVQEACFQVTAGTATNTVDYADETYTATFAAGEGGTKLIPVVIFDDSEPEGPETFGVIFFTGGPECDANYGQPVSAVLTILDDESVLAIPALGGPGLVVLAAALLAAGIHAARRRP